MIRIKAGEAVKSRLKPKGQATAARPAPKPALATAPIVGSSKFLPVTISLDQAMIDRLDDRAHEMRLTRSAAIRVLLAEVLGK